jgi:hypothetical protein
MAPKVWETIITECKYPVENLLRMYNYYKGHAGRRKFTKIKIISNLIS